VQALLLQQRLGTWGIEPAEKEGWKNKKDPPGIKLKLKLRGNGVAGGERSNPWGGDRESGMKKN